MVSGEGVVCDLECSMSSLNVGNGWLLVALARAAPHDWIVPDSSVRTGHKHCPKLTSKMQVNYKVVNYHVNMFLWKPNDC